MTTPASNMDQYFFRASAEDFKKIPGSPLIYHLSGAVYRCFEDFPTLIEEHHACSGLQSGNNDMFLRQWFEVAAKSILSRPEQVSERDNYRWYFHRKGGGFRKWYGNIDYILDWKDDGARIRASKSARPQNLDRWFNRGVTWSHTSSSSFSARLLNASETINVEGPSAFADNPNLLLGYLSSKVAYYLMGILNPTLHFLVGTVSLLPYQKDVGVPKVIEELISISRTDWDSYETSWDFAELPLLQPQHRGDTLEQTYANLRAYWQEQTMEMQRLEEENNRIFIEAYGLEDELTPDVPLSEITLTCNPSYRYSRAKDQTEEKLEAILLADTMREFVSYAVGCMFGRYSLDKPGLILANQGEGVANYHAQVPEPRFAPEEHGVIPILDENWFTNDIVERFHTFLRTTFGEQHFEENLAFVEESLNDKGRKKWNVREYFVKEFYNDHVRTYKKRPIYWMFSSPKGSFNALIYLHRYRSDTISIVLNEYLREYAAKLRIQKAELEALSIREDLPAKDRTDAEKGIDKLRKTLSELEDYERDVLHPLAGDQLDIDLDDGVKANYPKFKTALKKVTGLS